MISTGGPLRQRGVPTLTVQTSFDPQRVKWRWGIAEGLKCSALTAWRDATSITVKADSPIGINLSQLTPGVRCVEIAAEPERRDWAKVRFRVEMPPR